MTSANPDHRILVVGIYLTDVPNTAQQLSAAITDSSNWLVDIRWTAIGRTPPPRALQPITQLHYREKRPKFTLINELIANADLPSYRHLAVTDDDISLSAGFTDRYFASVEAHDFALAQPARTHDSYIDHYFVSQLLGVEARETRFVEIGPLFSVARPAFGHLIPFDERAPMGWGLDHRWPRILSDAHLRLGIVDSAPVTHSIRKPVSYYDYSSTRTAMEDYLAQHPHLPLDEAFTIIESFPTPTQTAVK